MNSCGTCGDRTRRDWRASGSRPSKGARKKLAQRKGAGQKRKLDSPSAAPVPAGKLPPPADAELIARVERRLADWVNRPACAALANIAVLEVTIDPDAEPGPRELRLVTALGVTNPMVFYVGQVPEIVRPPMQTCVLQVLGKEQLALRQRPPEEVELRTEVPGTVNGQVSSGEVNHYRFEARQGQRLVITTKARELVPFVADAVPGWFQPVVSICDSEGNELAFNDDFRFHPDPTLMFEVPQDGEYVLKITDAIYRGREDFVYRVTIGELPLVTSIFPLGAQVGQPVSLEMDGWNLDGCHMDPLPDTDVPGIQWVAVRQGNWVTNRMPFERSQLPDGFDQESNDDIEHAQQVTLGVIINGRIDRPDDWDVFEIQARAGQKIVADVSARKLESPLDSVLKVTDADGNLVAINDDLEDVGAGTNTHHADSYVLVKIPADGNYYVHLGDTSRSGSPAHAYRLRLSKPMPDFELRVVPSCANLRRRSATNLTVHAIRKDGFEGEIRLDLKDAPEGILTRGAPLLAGADTARLSIRTTLNGTPQPVNLVVEGTAQLRGESWSHEAVPAEDRMQAFLWQHLVPAQDLPLYVLGSINRTSSSRTPDPEIMEKAKVAVTKKSEQPTFTKRQVAGRLRQLKSLYDEHLLTDEFYGMKVAECETVLE